MGIKLWKSNHGNQAIFALIKHSLNPLRKSFDGRYSGTEQMEDHLG